MDVNPAAASQESRSRATADEGARCELAGQEIARKMELVLYFGGILMLTALNSVADIHRPTVSMPVNPFTESPLTNRHGSEQSPTEGSNLSDSIATARPDQLLPEPNERMNSVAGATFSPPTDIAAEASAGRAAPTESDDDLNGIPSAISGDKTIANLPSIMVQIKMSRNLSSTFLHSNERNDSANKDGGDKCETAPSAASVGEAFAAATARPDAANNAAEDNRKSEPLSDTENQIETAGDDITIGPPAAITPPITSISQSIASESATEGIDSRTNLSHSLPYNQSNRGLSNDSPNRPKNIQQINANNAADYLKSNQSWRAANSKFNLLSINEKFNHHSRLRLDNSSVNLIKSARDGNGVAAKNAFQLNSTNRGREMSDSVSVINDVSSSANSSVATTTTATAINMLLLFNQTIILANEKSSAVDKQKSTAFSPYGSSTTIAPKAPAIAGTAEATATTTAKSTASPPPPRQTESAIATTEYVITSTFDDRNKAHSPIAESVNQFISIKLDNDASYMMADAPYASDVSVTSNSSGELMSTVASANSKVENENGTLKTWPVKHSAIVEGDVILGGLMMVHSREDSITCGPIMPQGGIQALEVMLYTLDMINESGLLPNISLGAHILDDCDKDTYGLEMAVDFIKGKFAPHIFPHCHCSA